MSIEEFVLIFPGLVGTVLLVYMTFGGQEGPADVYVDGFLVGPEPEAPRGLTRAVLTVYCLWILALVVVSC